MANGGVKTDESRPDAHNATRDGALRESAGSPRRTARGRHICAALFALSDAGAVGLAAMYRWPTISVATYFFIIRPAFVWFAGLLPFLVVGAFGVRRRWIVSGCAVWLVGLVLSEETLPLLRPGAQTARARFAAARMGYASFMAAAGADARPDELPLRVITWNIAGGRFGLEDGVAHLARLDPDIVLLQEVTSNVRQAVVQTLRESEAFKGYHLDAPNGLILSRFPVERLAGVALPGGRGGMWRVNLDGLADLICINVHLSPHDLRTQVLRGWTWAGLRDAMDLSAYELGLVHLAVRELGAKGPVLLAGDFNLPPHYPHLRRATVGLKDCFRARGFGWGKTAPAKAPAVRVDQVYVEADVKVHYAAAVPTRYSDHFMTMAEISLPIPPSKAGGAVSRTPGDFNNALGADLPAESKQYWRSDQNDPVFAHKRSGQAAEAL